MTMPLAEIIISSSSPRTTRAEATRPGLLRHVERRHAHRAAPVRRYSLSGVRLPKPCSVTISSFAVWIDDVHAGQRSPGASLRPRTPPLARAAVRSTSTSKRSAWPCSVTRITSLAGRAVLDPAQLVVRLEVHRDQAAAAHRLEVVQRGLLDLAHAGWP